MSTQRRGSASRRPLSTTSVPPEQLDPSTDTFLGSRPQAFSRLGTISSAVNLARHLDRDGG